MATRSIFTLEAVNALVPRLRDLMDRQMARRAEIEVRVRQLSKLTGQDAAALRTFRLEPADPPAVCDLKHDIASRIEKYEAAWSEVETMGAVLKDPQRGLVDFYGQVDGKLVWLCWRYGEEAVSHYHPLDEGFAGRKPIYDQLRQRHLN